MHSKSGSFSGIGRMPLRRAAFGTAIGLTIGMIGQGVVPSTSAYRVISDSNTLGQVLERVDEGEYRITMRCPVRNKQVTYHVKADHAGGAHMALEWVLPACELRGLGKAGAAEHGMSWFVGAFSCPGTHFRRTLTVTGSDTQEAESRAHEVAPGCRIDTIDQTHCPVINPLCSLQSEDHKIEAELSRHHLLR